MVDRALLPLLQARPGMSPPLEYPPGGHPDPGLLCDHRLPVDPPLDRRQADAANLRDARSVPAGMGEPGRGDGSSREAQGQVEGTACPDLTARPGQGSPDPKRGSPTNEEDRTWVVWACCAVRCCAGMPRE